MIVSGLLHTIGVGLTNKLLNPSAPMRRRQAQNAVVYRMGLGSFRAYICFWVANVYMWRMRG
jgi:hypothetical protein